jgi:hypothetical protein
LNHHSFDGCAAKAQKGQGIGGSRAARALGAVRGWRQRCPVDVGAAQGGRWGFHHQKMVDFWVFLWWI